MRSTQPTKIRLTADLAAPTVPAALPLLADEVAYTIPRSAQIGDLQIDIEELWGGTGTLDPGEITTVTFLWDGVVVDTRTQEAPYGDEILPFSGWIPEINSSSPGLHRLQYIVDLASNGNITMPSLPIEVNIDKEAPNQGQRGKRLIFPNDIVDSGVTDDYLANPINNDQVVAIVPRWPDMRLEDTVEAYLSLLPAGRRSHRRSRTLDVVARVVIEQHHKDGDPIELVFEGDTLRQHRNADYDAHYYLIDRGGSEGPRSLAATLLIDLTPSPSLLRPPEVPQANADSNSRIDLDDARAPGGVFMNILEITDADADDVLRPTWNLIPLPQIIIGAGQAWPIRVPIDWPTLASGGFEMTPGTILARYTWQRGTGAERFSQPRFVPVDLTVAGPINPDNPDPVNRLLERATVKGLTGDDVLTIADRDRPARVVVPLYAGPVSGQILELIWNNDPLPVDTYTVQRGDREGQEIEFFIPWALIEPIEIDVVPLYYWTFNGINRQRAPDKPVTVSVVPIAGLKRPEFPQVSYDPGPDSGFIGCTLKPHPVHGVQVEIPGDDTRLEEHDVIELSWAGYASTNGNSSTLIPGTEGSWSHTLTLEEASNGYSFTVPFDPYIKLPGLVKPEDYEHKPRHGSAIAQYEVIRNGVPAGTSGRNLVFVTLIRPNSPPCLGED